MPFGLSDILNPFQGSKKKIYGTKPVVPELKTAADAQKEALAANSANFADIAKLATQVNTLNQDQLNALIDKTLGPGVREQFQQNLASQARGEIPQDVRNAIYRGNAERGAATNAFGGGGFSRNVTARDLGLTSLQITNNALSSAEQWLQAAKAPTFDAMGMFGISTQQQYAANQDQFNRNFAAAKIAAAPDPVARGQFDSDMAITGMILGIYGGGAGYQNSYKPQGDQMAPSFNRYGGDNSMYVPQQFQNYGYNFGGGGLAGAYQQAGVSNPYSLGGYGAGGSGGLAGPGAFGY